MCNLYEEVEKSSQTFPKGSVSFEVEYRHVSPIINNIAAIKSQAMNFPSMVLMFSFLFQFCKFVISRHVLLERMKTNLSDWTSLRFDLNFVYRCEKALLWQRIESMANFSFCLKSSSHLYDISITSSFNLTFLFSSYDRYHPNSVQHVCWVMSILNF